MDFGNKHLKESVHEKVVINLRKLDEILDSGLFAQSIILAVELKSPPKLPSGLLFMSRFGIISEK